MFKKVTNNPILWTDGYKFLHKDQYPRGLSWVYEVWTARKSRIEGVNHAVFFGLQGALSELYWQFEEGFFRRPEAEVMEEIVRNFQGTFGRLSPQMVAEYDFSHFADLHRLGYLPIRLTALPEGSLVPIGVPMFTIENTRPEFFWLPGFLEVVLSNLIWQPITCATIADLYRRILDGYAQETSDQPGMVKNQAGDFSMRGMAGPEAAYRAAGGHLLSFDVSSTISVREYLAAYYQAGPDVSLYAPSTEHSVMCSYGRDELAAYQRLISEVYPTGNVTIVSDSYDFWGVVDQVLPKLSNQILARHGKVGIRPDSGDPVKILCGDPDSANASVRKGLVQCLYEIFGGKTNSKGYKELDPHIGATYGDSITTKRAQEICAQLKAKGFASTNVVLGIGSYTYQYMTRDTLGFALKCTAEVIDGQFKAIFKDPKTDSGNFKKSHKGLVAVVRQDGDYRCIDQLDPQTIQAYEEQNALQEAFKDGTLSRVAVWDDIKQRVAEESARVYAI